MGKDADNRGCALGAGLFFGLVGAICVGAYFGAGCLVAGIGIGLIGLLFVVASWA